MKRQRSDVTRSAPAHFVKHGAVRWQGGVPPTEQLWFGLRGLPFSAFMIGWFTCFYSFVYLIRLLARGVARIQRRRHKPATGASNQGRRRRPDRHRSIDRRHDLTANISFSYSLFSFGVLTAALLEMNGVERHPRYPLGRVVQVGTL
jgi:hypothetical protein